MANKDSISSLKRRIYLLYDNS